MSQCSLDLAPNAQDCRPAQVLRPEEIRQRVTLLPPLDRELFLQLSTGRHSLRQLARSIGVNPGALSRRIAGIRNRLDHPAIPALLARGHTLSTEYYRVGIAHFAEGKRACAIAREMQIGPRAVASIIAYLRGWSRSESHRQREPADAPG